MKEPKPMIRLSRFSMMLLFLGPALAACRSFPTKEILGCVLDPTGRPVANTRIGANWDIHYDPNSGIVGFGSTLASDENGRFSGRIRWEERGNVLMVSDSSGNQGALMRMQEGGIEGPITVTLAPLVTVNGELDPKHLSGWRLQPEYAYMNLSVALLPEDEYVADWVMGYGKFTIKLPPGDYRLVAFGNAQGFKKTLSLRADRPNLDLGRIELEVPAIERQSGKAPHPWNVTDARGLRKDVKPTDFKGRWLLVEFWTYW